MTKFSRFVQIGRVVVFNLGEDAGKVAVIVDVIDANRVLVDGPGHGVHRQVVNVRRINLTDLTINIARGAREKKIKKEWAAAGIDAKWTGSAWAKKSAAREAKAELNDLGRFKAMLGKKAVAKKLRTKLSA